MAVKGDWIGAAADDVEARVARDLKAGLRKPDDPIVCASGISPSGPIHLGNLRELMTTHMVAEELHRRGHPVDHIHSWDDYDRFRKVPQDVVPESFVEHIGKPLSHIPDPEGELPSYADRFIGPLQEAAEALGVRCRWVRQSEMYPAGAYRQQIHTALTRRHEIFDILSRYQTEKLQTVSVEERRAAFWPIKVYSPATGTDDTEVLHHDTTTGEVTYRCPELGEARFNVLEDEQLHCKLVWKVDWPMRWQFERVVFEPGGMDHGAPGSSYTVGTSLAPQLFEWEAPQFVQYAFVGMAGRTKMSGSLGGGATPKFALRFVEPAILRWMYLRRAARKAFDIDFGANIWRTYDEFDRQVAKAGTDKQSPLEALTLARSTATSVGPVPVPARPMSFRLMSTAADMTDGNVEQVLRIVADHIDGDVDTAVLAEELEPRLGCALGWAEHCLPEDERLSVRDAFSQPTWEALSDEVRQAVGQLTRAMADDWSLPGLTTQVYGAPKLVRGLPIDTAPTPELKAFQRSFFAGVYQLVLGADTGPRLPTLLLSLGRQRVEKLLTPG
ncbi:MAG: lysine--tRNA ligase [Myxococcales bacterium]|nr:lysine--tRNA ligase [Myxococcales bacterium]